MERYAWNPLTCRPVGIHPNSAATPSPRYRSVNGRVMGGGVENGRADEKEEKTVLWTYWRQMDSKMSSKTGTKWF
ncbi:hypothetical protein HAL_33040 [Haladaptatus sp. T7]|nr:hypothetical protein HAL_33040 [Haladaptatus sp. T7]